MRVQNTRQRFSAANCFCQFPNHREWQTNWFDLPPILAARHTGTPQCAASGQQIRRVLRGNLVREARRTSESHRSQSCQIDVFDFCDFGWAAPWAARSTHRPRCRVGRSRGGSCCLWVGVREGLVCGFGNEGVVFNEGPGDYSFRPVDSELDECKRNPLVAFLDDAGFAENDFLRYEVMREAVSFTCHKAPPVFWVLCFWLFE